MPESPPKPEIGPLSKAHRQVLRLIADRTDERSPDPGVMTSSATFADTYNAFVHWRTAQALHRRGLVTYPYIGSGYDGDGTSIALTLAGWEAIGRTPKDADTALPAAPCHACGPGYRIGDEGCRHDPYEPLSGEAGICRTCAQPIWWEQGTVGHQSREGWSDRIERGGDSLVCFKAVHYRHQPMGSREAAIYRAGFKAGQTNLCTSPAGGGDDE